MNYWEYAVYSLQVQNLFISAKFDENDPMIPDLKDILNIYPKLSFTVEIIRKYEFLCIKALGYNLKIFTAYHFIYFFSNCGYVFSDDTMIQCPTQTKTLVRKKSNSAIPSVNITISSNTFPNDDNCSTKSAQNTSVDRIYESTIEILSYFVEGIFSLD